MDSFTCYGVPQRLVGRIVAVLDGDGQQTTLPGTPVWGSSDNSVAIPHQASNGLSADIEVETVGECDIYVDTGVSDTPTSLVQGRCHLVAKPEAGEVRRVIIELSTAP